MVRKKASRMHNAKMQKLKCLLWHIGKKFQPISFHSKIVYSFTRSTCYPCNYQSVFENSDFQQFSISHSGHVSSHYSVFLRRLSRVQKEGWFELLQHYIESNVYHVFYYFFFITYHNISLLLYKCSTCTWKMCRNLLKKLQ